MNRRALILAGLASILSGCGGGAEAGSSIIAMYGDSITDDAGELNPGPVQELESLLNSRIINYAKGGKSISEVVIYPNDGATCSMFRMGGADALHKGIEFLPIYKDLLTKAIITSLALGRSVIVTGTITLAYPSGFPHEIFEKKQYAMNAYSDAAKEIAEKLNVPFIDIREVHFYGISDLRDIVHPAQAYSTRISKHIAAEITSKGMKI